MWILQICFWNFLWQFFWECLRQFLENLLWKYLKKFHPQLLRKFLRHRSSRFYFWKLLWEKFRQFLLKNALKISSVFREVLEEFFLNFFFRNRSTNFLWIPRHIIERSFRSLFVNSCVFLPQLHWNLSRQFVWQFL